MSLNNRGNQWIQVHSHRWLIIFLLGLCLTACGGSGGSPDDRGADSPTDDQNRRGVSIEGRWLLVDEAPLYIKGVCWNPVGIGGSRPQDLDFAGFADIDLDLMEQLGINTVRTYEPIEDTQVLDKLHERGIGVIYSLYNWGGADPSSVDELVNAVKDHPAILMWSVGNEWNYNGLYLGLENFNLDQSIERLNEVIQRIKNLDTEHPVSSIYGELPPTHILERMPLVDVWGVNIYRGISFGNLFSVWQQRSEKPMYIAEYGADAFNSTQGVEDQNSHSFAVTELTGEIAHNSIKYSATGVSSGGFIFEWADEWWKAGNPSQQDIGDTSAVGGAPYPDGVFNEEWWGIVDINRNRRQAFDSLKDKFAEIDSLTPFAPPAGGTVN